MTQIRAALCRSPLAPFSIEAVTLEPARAGELRIRLVGCGICHTDMGVRDGQIPVGLPIVLGHEGSGIVEEVGEGVTVAAPGDPVLLSFTSCGACPNCDDHYPAACYNFAPLNFFGGRADGSTSLSANGEKVFSHFFGQSAFATHAVVPERSVVKVPASARHLPLELLGPLGCGLQTGAGAVLNCLGVKPGRSIAIFGAGGVGLAAVMAAKIAGADPIIAIDLHDHRLDLARELGATHTIRGDADLSAEITAICPQGLVYAFDTTGLPQLIELAFSLLAPRGSLGLVGASSMDEMLSINEFQLMGGGKTIKGILEGDSFPPDFIPLLLDHHLAGRFPFDRLIEVFPFEAINEAFEAGESGRVIKPVLRMGG
jgi:aryl-alcohol dehydrogenase